MLIKNVTVYSMVNEPIRHGFLVTDGKKIIALGSMEDCPAYDGEIIDGEGAYAFPGLIDAHTHLGMFEDSLGFEGDDGNEETDPSTPNLRALDAVNPLDRCFEEALSAGITTVVTGPGSANPIGGQMIAIKTLGGCVDDMVLKEPVAMKFALGENPKSVYNGKNQTPVTRMATAAIIREQLTRARKYLQDQSEAVDDEEIDMPEYDAKCEALAPLFRDGMPAHFHAHRLDDIFTAVRIANEFHLNYTIVHGTQGHKMAEVLAKKGVTILSGPLLCDRSKPELHDLTPASPGILSRAGIKTAIVTDHPVIPIQYLPICAGLAVREGMEPMDALRAMTILPAEICGMSDRVGSLEPGKDADIVLFNELPLTINAKAQAVIVDGKRVR